MSACDVYREVLRIASNDLGLRLPDDVYSALYVSDLDRVDRGRSGLSSLWRYYMLLAVRNLLMGSRGAIPLVTPYTTYRMLR